MYLKLVLLNDIMHKDITTVQTASNIAKFMLGLKWREGKTKLLEKWLATMIGDYIDTHYYYSEAVGLKEIRAGMNLVIAAGWSFLCWSRRPNRTSIGPIERLRSLSHNLSACSGKVNAIMHCMFYGCYSQESGYQELPERFSNYLTEVYQSYWFSLFL